jgi:hypothetical protein
VLALFDERYEKLIADHPDAKKEMDLVRACIVQIGQLVQNSNQGELQWRRVKATSGQSGSREAHPLHVPGWMGAVYRLISHVCGDILVQGNEGQASTELQGIGTASRTKQAPKERVRNSVDECCTKKQKWPPPTYQNSRSVATNNFFALLKDLLMGNADPSSEGNSTETPETNDSLEKVGHPRHINSGGQLSLQRELKIFVTGEIFRKPCDRNPDHNQKYGELQRHLKIHS